MVFLNKYLFGNLKQLSVEVKWIRNSSGSIFKLIVKKIQSQDILKILTLGKVFDDDNRIRFWLWIFFNCKTICRLNFFHDQACNDTNPCKSKNDRIKNFASNMSLIYLEHNFLWCHSLKEKSFDSFVGPLPKMIEMRHNIDRAVILVDSITYPK